MAWSDRMNPVISYIEDNLADDIDFDIAAEKACCSLFHFQRMLFAIIGVIPWSTPEGEGLPWRPRSLPPAVVKRLM